MSLTIITVCFNDLKRLKDTCDSIDLILSNDIKHLIYDGQSNDGTAAYLRLIESKYRSCVSVADNGLYDAMNKATAMINSDWVLYLNCGDLIDATFPWLEWASFNGDVAAIVCGYQIMRNEVICKVEPREMRWGIKPSVHQAIIFNRKLLDNAPYNCSYKYCADYELFKKIVYSTRKVVSINKSIVYFDDVDGESKRNKFNCLRECYKIEKEYLGFAKNATGFLITAVKVVFMEILTFFKIDRIYFNIKYKI